jgi:hypothetical protein
MTLSITEMIGSTCPFNSVCFHVVCVCLVHAVCAILVEPAVYLSRSCHGFMWGGAIMRVCSTVGAFLLIWISFLLGWSLSIMIIAYIIG